MAEKRTQKADNPWALALDELLGIIERLDGMRASAQTASVRVWLSEVLDSAAAQETMLRDLAARTQGADFGDLDLDENADRRRVDGKVAAPGAHASYR